MLPNCGNLRRDRLFLVCSVLFAQYVCVVTQPCGSLTCSVCDNDSAGNVIKVVCTDVDIPLLPDSVQEMYLSDGTVSKAKIFKDYLFIGKTNLHKIQLKNYSINMVWSSPFVNLTDLIYVDLSFNHIMFFDKSNLAGPVALEILNLNHNIIQQITNNAFSNQTSLRELHLSANKITVISADAFNGLTSLEILDLSYNRISTINAHAFQTNSDLHTIILRRNMLHTVESHLFEGLSHLTSVDLQRNLLISLGQDAFTGTNLTMLDISRNMLHDVQSTMQVLKAVSNKDLEVNLFANTLNTSYAAGIFSGLTLKSLNLQHNSISAFQQGAFLNCHVMDLNLEFNNIQSLPSSIETYLQQVKPTVSLDHNKWQCDCNILWFSKYLRKLSPPVLGTKISSTLQCFGPAGLQNHVIQDVAPIIEPGCKITVKPPTTSISTTKAKTSLQSTSSQSGTSAKVSVISMNSLPSGVTKPTVKSTSRINTNPSAALQNHQNLHISAMSSKSVTSLKTTRSTIGLPALKPGYNVHNPVTNNAILNTFSSSNGVNWTNSVHMTFSTPSGQINSGKVSANSQSKSGLSQAPNESDPTGAIVGAAVGSLIGISVLGGVIGWFLYRKFRNNGKVNGYDPSETDYLWDKKSRSLGPSKTYFDSANLKNFQTNQT